MRIREIRKQLGITQTELADASDLSRPYISILETGATKKSPSIDTLSKIAQVLGVGIGDLFYDTRQIAIAGRIGAGAKVELVDAYEKGEGLYKVACPPRMINGHKVVGVEVSGDSMAPVYRDGDVLFYARQTIGVPSEALGAICVCEDMAGNAWVKQVRLGSEKGKFNLISVNPLSDNILDVRLKWAAPVLLHWPRALIDRVE